MLAEVISVACNRDSKATPQRGKLFATSLAVSAALLPGIPARIYRYNAPPSTRETDPHYPIVRRFPIDLVSVPFTTAVCIRLCAVRLQCNIVRLHCPIVSRVYGIAIEIPHRSALAFRRTINNDLIKSARGVPSLIVAAAFNCATFDVRSGGRGVIATTSRT